MPYYQQRADLNVANIQEVVRKAAIISIQTAQPLSAIKPTKLDIKGLLMQQVDSIALLGHTSHELACLRRRRIKCVSDHGQQSKFLFGDDLPKWLKDAKETGSVGQVVKIGQGRIIPLA